MKNLTLVKNLKLALVLGTSLIAFNLNAAPGTADHGRVGNPHAHGIAAEASQAKSAVSVIKESLTPTFDAAVLSSGQSLRAHLDALSRSDLDDNQQQQLWQLVGCKTTLVDMTNLQSYTSEFMEHKGESFDTSSVESAIESIVLPLRGYFLLNLAGKTWAHCFNFDQDLTNVENLDLSNKQISQLQPASFHIFGGLTTLNLSSNQLTSLPANLFQGLEPLRELDLSSNRLSSLDPNTFQGLHALERLYLSSNQLSSLPANTFHGLHALEWLFLRSNRLSNLLPNTFQGLNALRELYLSSNHLISLPANTFHGLEALTMLELGSNRLSSLPANTFHGLEALTMLELGSNQLSSLDPNTFQGLNALTVLGFESNRLTEMPASLPQSLTLLYLNNNPLAFTTITPGYLGRQELVQQLGVRVMLFWTEPTTADGCYHNRLVTGLYCLD